MGCDIHLYVEILNKELWKWEAQGNFIDEYPEEEWGFEDIPWKEKLYSGRNYNLFAILADVRNGRGFAGVQTGGGFNPIAFPKGLPDNVSSRIGDLYRRWGEDAHSASHFTVQELLEFDWTQKTVLCGMISALEYAKWKWPFRIHDEPDGPKEYTGGVSGTKIKIVNEEEMDEYLNKICPDEMDSIWKRIQKLEDCSLDSLDGTSLSYYTEAVWTQKYYETCSIFIGRVLPELLAMGNSNEVRIVFWFDN